MKFEYKHVFDVPVDELERVLFHDKTSALLSQRMQTIIEIEPVSVVRNGDRLERKVRYLPVPMIKSIGVKKVEPEWMEWHEVSTYDYATHTGTFQNIPARHRIAAVLTNRGTLSLEPNGRGGSKEVLRGELKVNVFIVGKIAERVIHANAVKILDEQARVVEGIIRAREI